MSDITTTLVGTENGLNVYEVRKDGEVIGHNYSAPDDTEAP